MVTPAGVGGMTGSFTPAAAAPARTAAMPVRTSSSELSGGDRDCAERSQLARGHVAAADALRHHDQQAARVEGADLGTQELRVGPGLTEQLRDGSEIGTRADHGDLDDIAAALGREHEVVEILLQIGRSRPVERHEDVDRREVVARGIAVGQGGLGLHDGSAQHGHDQQARGAASSETLHGLGIGSGDSGL